MKIALLVPSRERLDLKRNLIDSLISTSNNIGNVVLYFGIDDDDPTKKNVIEMADRYDFIKIVNIENKGKFLGVGKLWNICANQCSEEIMSMIGDDMVFKTKGWDDRILTEFNSFNCPKDNLKMVYCNDGRHGDKISVNAFVHRSYMEINGYFMREEFYTDYIDIWLQHVFFAIGRLKYLGDVLIEHRHWSFGKGIKDNVANNLRGNGYPEHSAKIWEETRQLREKEIRKLANFIGITPNLSRLNRVLLYE